MKRKIFAVIGLAFVSVATYMFVANDESTSIENENIKEMVLDFSVGNIKEGQSASISSHQLVVTDSDGSQLSYDISNENFFVSIAPYVDQTHP